MPSSQTALLTLPVVIVAGCTARAVPQQETWWPSDYAENMRLWYRKPAREWVEALPVGNGRLGAMVVGRRDRERIQLNEESVWARRRLNDTNPGARQHLGAIRQLIFEGRNPEARDRVPRGSAALRS